MSSENNQIETQNSLPRWLNTLHRDSWQMELLIMGFTIFLLAAVPAKLKEAESYLSIHLEDGPLLAFSSSTLEILIIVVYILLFNLISDIVLRGVWIGYVGLSSVYTKGVNFNRLPYQPWYINYFKKRFPTPQRSIVKLDKLCSQIFAFTFLIIFYILSFLLYISEIVALAFLINYTDDNSEDVLMGITIFILVTYSFLSLIYFSDFISAGLLKRFKFFGKVYRVIYIFFGYSTLAFVYRDIYYIFLSNTNKWAFKGIIIAYLVVPVAVSNIDLMSDYSYFYSNTDTYRFANDYYDNRRVPNRPIKRATLSEDIVLGRYLGLFIRYDKNYNEVLNEFCPEYETFDDADSITVFGRNLGKPDSLNQREVALQCLSGIFRVTINEVEISPTFMFYSHPNKNEKGIFAYIDVTDLTPQQHWISVERRRINKRGSDKPRYRKHVKIPFWKE